jgi:hypothetical protein
LVGNFEGLGVGFFVGCAVGFEVEGFAVGFAVGFFVGDNEMPSYLRRNKTDSKLVQSKTQEILTDV